MEPEDEGQEGGGEGEEVEVKEEGGRRGRRFELKKWNAVALWTWDIGVDSCAICRNSIMDMCIEAQANPDGALGCENGCTVAWGQCSHAFHFCCISRWLKTRTVCPLCSKEWEFSKIGN
jgi:RING-box protein 1